MPRKPSKARETILASAIDVIRQSGCDKLTIEGTAERAGVAKGLVHYHFKTKSRLLEAALEKLARTRCDAWAGAFETDSPQDAVDQTWSLLTEESANGTIRAWHSLLAVDHLLTGQQVKGALDRFNSAIGHSLAGMLARRMGLETTVPESEIGCLLAAVIHGTGAQMMAEVGGDLQGAYAAAWLGILSLTRPAQ